MVPTRRPSGEGMAPETPSAPVHQLSFFYLSSMGATVMAETSTIEMQDRELFAAMAMQALITRGERWAADLIAKQTVAYADALIVALAASDESPGS